MSKRKGINELSIMKKDMIKHLKKDMKDEMTRYKDDKDEIRRMVRGGTLITNYKGPGNTKRNVNYINDDKLITFEDIIDNVKTLYSPNYIYLQNQYKTGNLNPDENIAFDEATTYLKLKSPEAKSQFLINYKKKQEMNKKEYNERKKLQSELQEDREQVEKAQREYIIKRKDKLNSHIEEKIKNVKADTFRRTKNNSNILKVFKKNVELKKEEEAIVPYDIFKDERFTNIGNYPNHLKFEKYVLIPQVRQSLKLTDNFEPFLDHKRLWHGEIITIGDRMDNLHLDKSMASFDFIQKGINGGKNLLIDTKFYNNDKRGKKNILYQTGVQELIKAYDKIYKREKDMFENQLSVYEDLSDKFKEKVDVQKKGFDKWFHHSAEYNIYIPLTVAKIKGSEDGTTLVKWVGDKITVVTNKFKQDLLSVEDYADDIKFIFSYSDGVYEVNIKDLPFFNNERKELELGLDIWKKEYKLPPKYLKFIKKFI